MTWLRTQRCSLGIQRRPGPAKATPLSAHDTIPCIASKVDISISHRPHPPDVRDLALASALDVARRAVWTVVATSPALTDDLAEQTPKHPPRSSRSAPRARHGVGHRLGPAGGRPPRPHRAGGGEFTRACSSGKVWSASTRATTPSAHRARLNWRCSSLPLPSAADAGRAW